MKRPSYPSDLSDGQWKRIERLVLAPKLGGRPAKHDRLAILNAILYLVRTECAWRLLPHDMPSWKAVYHDFRCWRPGGTWERIHDQLRGEVRESAVAIGNRARPLSTAQRTTNTCLPPARPSSPSPWSASWFVDWLKSRVQLTLHEAGSNLHPMLGDW